MQAIAADLPRDEEGQVYDAMRVRARMVKFYGVGPAEFDRMDYMEFFGLLREMKVYVEERQPTTQAPGAFPDEWEEFGE